MWDGATMGRDRFWSVVQALEALGMVGRLDAARFDAGFGAFGGKAGALWPTAQLIALAAGPWLHPGDPRRRLAGGREPEKPNLAGWRRPRW